MFDYVIQLNGPRVEREYSSEPTTKPNKHAVLYKNKVQ